MSEIPHNHGFHLAHQRTLAAIALLAGSFLLISSFGSMAIYTSLKSAPGYNQRIALGRAAVFPLVMLFVHVVGYRLWQRQFTPRCVGGEGQSIAVYWPPTKTALVQQGICFILALLTLDMGETSHATMIALLAYWMSVGLIIARRLDAPTPGDLRFIRWSFLFIWFAVLIVGPIVWHRLEY
jgi:hypothetical protein